MFLQRICGQQYHEILTWSVIKSSATMEVISDYIGIKYWTNPQNVFWESKSLLIVHNSPAALYMKTAAIAHLSCLFNTITRLQFIKIRCCKFSSKMYLLRVLSTLKTPLDAIWRLRGIIKEILPHPKMFVMIYYYNNETW